MLREADGHAVLVSYEADGTPALARQIRMLRIEDYAPIRREGGKAVEFYLERCMVLWTDASGKQRGRVMTRDARAMPDKGAWAAYSAAVAFCPLARDLGHTGIVVHHYGFDRGALFLPLTRRLRARHKLFFEVKVPADVRWERSLEEWVVLTGCCDHDATNALKWAVEEFLEDWKKELKDVFVAVRALRDAYSLLMDWSLEWVVARVEFGPRRHSTEDCYKFWTLLGVEKAAVEGLVEFDIHWRDGKLHATSDSAPTPRTYERIAELFLAVAHIERFNEGRFCTLGETSRVLTACAEFGIADLVEWILQQPHVKTSYLKRFQRLQDKTRLKRSSIVKM